MGICHTFVMSIPENLHPCQKCGACCAIYRVSFWRSELSSGGNWKVPSQVVEDSGGSFVSLKGTTKTHRPACNSLQGKVGRQVGCAIYENRPSPCRNFEASYEDGYHRPRCDEARRGHGLKPLIKSEWKTFRKNNQIDI